MRWLNALLGVFAAAMVLFGIFHSVSTLPAMHQVTPVTNRELEDWTEGPSTADGDRVYTLTLPAGELSNCAILLWNNGQTVSLSLNGEELCVLTPKDFSEILQVSGMVLVDLPECSEDGTLQLTITPTSEGNVTRPRVVLGTSLGLLRYMLSENVGTAILLALLILLTVVVVFSSIFFQAFVSRGVRLAALLFFLIDGFLWAVTDTGLYMFLGMRLEVAAIICYYAFMLLPVPVLMQCFSISGKRNPAVNLMFLLLGLNLVVQTILSAAGIIPLQNMVLVTHVLMFLTLLSCLLMLHAALKETKNRFLRMYYRDMIVLTVFAVLAVVLYWFFGSTIYRVLTLSGMFVFHLVVEWIVLLEHRDEVRIQNEKEARTQVLETLSYTDAMTGLSNRRVFDDYLHEVVDNAAAHPNALLLMLDLNGLKIVNDHFGHQAGDILICTAADCLRNVFGDCALISRIGGDEFTVVMDDADHSPAWYTNALHEESARCNEDMEYKLSFAVGSSYLYDEKGLVKSVSDWKQEADNNMYRNKNRMKREGAAVGREGSLQEVLNGIVQAADARDANTAEHSVRVAALAVFLAEKAGLPEEEIPIIERAALLHNLGNISIPDNILMKPGNLTPEETATMQRHAIIGSSIVERAVGMESVARIILQHHERWDGLGYPDRLKGEEIEIGARIVALCDSIEAMTSPRSFRPGISWDDCRLEIEQNLGKRYDPELGQLVLDNWGEIIDIKMRKMKLL